MKSGFGILSGIALTVLLLLFMNHAKRDFSFRDVYEQPYFDTVLLLKKLPNRFYIHRKINGSFDDVASNTLLASGAKVNFKPLGYSTELHLQYTHVFSPKCVYRVDSTVYRLFRQTFPPRKQSGNGVRLRR